MSIYVKARLKNGMELSAPILDAKVFFGGSEKSIALFDFNNERFLKEVQRLNKKMNMG